MTALRDLIPAGKQPAVNPDGKNKPMLDLATIERLASRLTPPLSDGRERPGEIHIARVIDDRNNEPTEYAVFLPPEYSPLRTYPAVVALHSGRGETAQARMEGAIAWWSTEAAKRGYIVIAPEYVGSGRVPEYTYSADEHAAVVLALRDACKRFSIDSDRVFLGGQLRGGDMAWDLGLAHPDLFAGVAVVSGRPLKYVFINSAHMIRLPFYLVFGELGGGTEVIRDTHVKPLLMKNYDLIFVEYMNRGLEDFPEEAGAIFDWMASRVRRAVPPGFTVSTAPTATTAFTASSWDNSYPVAPSPPPPFARTAAISPRVHPAKIQQDTQSTQLLDRRLAIVRRLDLSSTHRFQEKNRHRGQRSSRLLALPKPDPEPYLEDLRVRGDRGQVYWLKIPVSY